MVTGQVTKLAPFGAFARIEGPLEGLIHISELVDRRVTHPRDVVREGDVLPLKIVRIERDRHRLGLSLKQVRPQAEQMGYVFDENGSVIAGPGEEVRRRSAAGGGDCRGARGAGSGGGGGRGAQRRAAPPAVASAGG